MHAVGEHTASYILSYADQVLHSGSHLMLCIWRFVDTPVRSINCFKTDRPCIHITSHGF